MGGRKRGNQYERWKREGLENGNSQAPTKIPCQIETGAQAWRTLAAPLLRPTTLLARYHHVDTSFVSLHPPPPPPSPYLSLGRYPGPLYFLYTSSSIFLLLLLTNGQPTFLPTLASIPVPFAIPSILLFSVSNFCLLLNSLHSTPCKEDRNDTIFLS